MLEEPSLLSAAWREYRNNYDRYFRGGRFISRGYFQRRVRTRPDCEKVSSDWNDCWFAQIRPLLMDVVFECIGRGRLFCLCVSATKCLFFHSHFCDVLVKFVVFHTELLDATFFEFKQLCLCLCGRPRLLQLSGLLLAYAGTALLGWCFFGVRISVCVL